MHGHEDDVIQFIAIFAMFVMSLFAIYVLWKLWWMPYRAAKASDNPNANSIWWLCMLAFFFPPFWLIGLAWHVFSSQSTNVIYADMRGSHIHGYQPDKPGITIDGESKTL